MPAYDTNNIFAKIIRGELPCHKVYEDDKALVFLDIMPRAPGHALVIPKSSARNVLDVAPDDLAHVIKIAQRVAKAGMQVFGAEGLMETHPIGRHLAAARIAHYTDGTTEIQNERIAAYLERGIDG